MSEEDTQIQHRRDKREALRQRHVDPYPARFDKPQQAAELLRAYAEGQAVRFAGRLTAKRLHGRSVFGDLRDATGRVQVYAKASEVGETVFGDFEQADLGDLLGVEGTLFTTKTGEVTIRVTALRLLAKGLRVLPEKWHGLKDVELRYRKRYLDLLSNEDSRGVFVQRARIITSIRSFLDARGFLEVETPMMHHLAGGAAGEPFITHHNSLDLDLYLRLAPELHLKRLLVGGFDRVYELNRSFRNEGLSTRHNPEFTMVETYAAYQDCRDVMAMTRQLICHVIQQVTGSVQFVYQGQRIDLGGAWETVSFADLVRERFGVGPEAGEAELYKRLAASGKVPAGSDAKLSRSALVRMIGELADPTTKQAPVFVIDHWTELSPLAKATADNPLLADRFELFLGGLELANGYSELNDPDEQRRRFEQQVAAGGSGQPRGRRSRTPGAGSSTGRIDEDYIEALEYGMPPAGGLGVGVDRLTMLCTDRPTIRDVILFPLLRPDSR